MMRCKAPIHRSRSGLRGFLTSTVTSLWPRSISAISCMANGLVLVLAPIHRISMPAARAARTWSIVATSVATSIPVSRFTACSHGSPRSPTPSKPPGIVRGFQTPALNIFTPIALNALAASSVCCSVSALHGPAMRMGAPSSMPGNDNGRMSCSFILSF